MPVIFEIPDKKVLEDKKRDIKVQYIPATIDGNCKANVDKFFDNYTEVDSSSGEAKILTNALRGFPLKGCEFQFPEDKVGVIYREHHKLTTEKTERVLKYSGAFNKFTYWNYDVNPSENDALRKTIGALGVLNAVHKGIDNNDS